MEKPWNGKNRRKNILEKYPTDKNRREFVRSSVLETSAQLYQMEQGIRIIFDPKFNVWQVIDNSLPSYTNLIYEIAGYGNQRIVFEFAMLIIKMKKYGLSEEETALYNALKGANDIKEYKGNGQKSTKSKNKK